MKNAVFSIILTLFTFALLPAQNGPVADYYDNGKKKYQGNLSDGKKVGEWTYYWDSGSVKREGIYKEGKPYGVWKEYFRDGQIKSEGGYGIKNGESVKHGDWVWYHKNGQPKIEGKYAQGKEVGLWSEYNNLGIRIKKMQK